MPPPSGQTSGIGTVTSSAALQSPEIVITPDLERAASYGVTSQAIADTIRVATSGAYDSSLSKLNLDTRQVAIRVTLDASVRQSIEKIAMIPVPATGGTVTLGAIADITLGSAPSRISRLDRSRNVTLSIELNGRNLPDVNAEVQALSAYQNLPDGVSFAEQGDLKRQAELFTSFASAMAIGNFCVYAVLVLLFHDCLQPITILTALPLALGGALFPLVVTGTSFSMPSVIGLLLLMGIVSKNSILLVDSWVDAKQPVTVDRYGKGDSQDGQIYALFRQTQGCQSVPAWADTDATPLDRAVRAIRTPVWPSKIWT